VFCFPCNDAFCSVSLGVGDLTAINIPAGDGTWLEHSLIHHALIQSPAGGEFDPHGADGNGWNPLSHHVCHVVLMRSTGNPIGGLVFSNAFGSIAQMHEWTVNALYD